MAPFTAVPVLEPRPSHSAQGILIWCHARRLLGHIQERREHSKGRGRFVGANLVRGPVDRIRFACRITGICPELG
jgi:hypothetical protein